MLRHGPADLLDAELDTLRGEMAQWSQQEEDKLSVKKICRTACNLLFIADTFFNNFRIKWFYSCTVFSAK